MPEPVPMFEYFGAGQFWVNPRAKSGQGRTIVAHCNGQVRWNAGINPNTNTGTWQDAAKFHQWVGRKGAKVYAVYAALVAEEYRSMACSGVPHVL